MKKVLLLFGFVIFSQFSFAQSIKNFNPILDLGEDLTICIGYIHILDAGAGFDAYLWQDGSIDQTFLVTEQGVYWVHAYLGSTMYADTIQIGYWPYPDPNLGNDTTLCFGEYIVLEAQGSFVSYSWQDGTNLPFYIVSLSGEYFVDVIDFNGCMGSDTILVEITNTLVSLGSDTVICECGSILLDAGEGYISYLWNDGSTSQYFFVDGTEFGVGSHYFDVTVVDSNNCESTDEILVYISEHAKVDEIENFIFGVYPNPGNDIIDLNLHNLPNESYLIKIFDSYGRVVYIDKVYKTQFQDEIRLDISNHKSGFYFLQISSKNIKAQRKLMIQER